MFRLLYAAHLLLNIINTLAHNISTEAKSDQKPIYLIVKERASKTYLTTNYAQATTYSKHTRKLFLRVYN